MAFDEIVILEFWASACRSAQSHASQMGHLSSRAAADMMHAPIKKFCEQPPPKTHDELSFRQPQAIAVSSWVSSISHADCMARLHPGVANQIFEVTRKACDRALPMTKETVNNVHMEAMKLSSEISTICHADSMRRLH